MRLSNLTITSAAVTSLLVLGAPLSAQTLNFGAAADTYVRYSPKGHESQLWRYDNYGTETTIGVTLDGGSLAKEKDRIGLIRFEIGLFDQPFQDASLFLSGGGNNNFQLYAIPDLGADENFVESGEDGITYDTFAYGYDAMLPPSDIPAGGLDSTGLTLVAEFSGNQEINISSSALLDFINADTNGIVTFILFRTTQSGTLTSFVSREAGNEFVPQLTLTQIPEPATMTLLFAGTSLLLVVYRRRRQQKN